MSLSEGRSVRKPSKEDAGFEVREMMRIEYTMEDGGADCRGSLFLKEGQKHAKDLDWAIEVLTQRANSRSEVVERGEE